MEILGAQVPDVIAERIFCIFASIVSVQAKTLGASNADTGTTTVGNSSGGVEE